MTRLAIDIGSAFIDLVLIGNDALQVHKAPLIQSPAEALGDGLRQLGCTPADLQEIRIASTAPLNALLSRTPARVGLLTTAGFGDTLQLARQNRLDLYDPVARSGAPGFLLAEDACHEIGGRIAAGGQEVVPLDETAVRNAALALRDKGIEAIAICFLFSHVTPDHECHAAKVISEVWPGVPVSLSHLVDPAPREYERTVSTLLDSWLRRTALPELTRLMDWLTKNGFSGRFLFGDGRAGVVSHGVAFGHPAAILGAGPAAAGAAAARLASDGVALGVDIGSVSTDLTLVRGGNVDVLDGAVWAGVPLRQAMVDIQSVAMGGCRRVRLTPEGPCFGVAAPDAPTLQDALIALERIGGPTDAADRIAAFARSAGSTPETAALSIVKAAEDEVAAQIMRFAARRNVDPSRADLVAMGGLGPVLASGIARALNMPRIRIPSFPAVAGALGLAQLPMRFDATVRPDIALPDLTQGRMADLRAKLHADLSRQVAAAGAVQPGPPQVLAWLAARPQMHPIRVSLDAFPVDGADLAALFAEAYDTQYGLSPPGVGHLFRLSLICEARPGSVPVATVPAGDQSAAGRFGARVTTDAGTIWTGPGWRLTAHPQGWDMRPEGSA